MVKKDDKLEKDDILIIILIVLVSLGALFWLLWGTSLQKDSMAYEKGCNLAFGCKEVNAREQMLQESPIFFNSIVFLENTFMKIPWQIILLFIIIIAEFIFLSKCLLDEKEKNKKQKFLISLLIKIVSIGLAGIIIYTIPFGIYVIFAILFLLCYLITYVLFYEILFLQFKNYFIWLIILVVFFSYVWINNWLINRKVK